MTTPLRASVLAARPRAPGRKSRISPSGCQILARPAEYASVKVGISLESHSHDAPAGASQSILHASASTAGVAIQRCAVLPRGRRLSLSGSPGKTPVRHAPVRASMPGKNRPYSRPTSPRETDTRASQERLASPPPATPPPPLFERQCRVRIDHTLGRHPLAKQIHERVKRDSRPPD